MKLITKNDEYIKSTWIECPICKYVNTYEYDNKGIVSIFDKCEHFDKLDEQNPEIVIFKNLKNYLNDELKDVGMDEELAELGYKCIGHIPDLVTDKSNTTIEEYKKIYDKKYFGMWLWERQHDSTRIITKDFGNTFCGVYAKTYIGMVDDMAKKLENYLKNNDV